MRGLSIFIEAARRLPECEGPLKAIGRDGELRVRCDGCGESVVIGG
jgi:hypothetical protein